MRLREQGKIWLIGGTGDSATVAQSLLASRLPCVVTVTTEAAKRLYPSSPLLTVVVGGLEESQLGAFQRQYGILGVVDASHPFARQISELAIAFSHHSRLPYLRFERSACTTEPNEAQKGLIPLDSFDTLLNGDYLTNQRVLLTVGCQVLPRFQDWLERATLFARILPTLNALQTALAAGFSPDRLIALRPPIQAELEEALWRQWEISLVVTKASGKAGGEAIKRQVAAKLGIPLIVINRPPVNYPHVTEQIEQVIEFCQDIFTKVNYG
ncbi:cobalt-precorrin-6A reductase [Spirulina sp. CS-785/01]|uniref:cobalt-precorrin-6A reductase n=1 Tax=Spirulina sp. CS-785/01 TaxID=3021716 RepID=UPI00232ED3BF|nr:cobalt-precorrin-6A reductase [Spirulina sp. CS-785/01]MDB9312525.1 cobalt-precorrin-6A reductase [Spirulina sp. CS-785/01]